MKTLFVGLPVYKGIEPEAEATLNDIVYMESEVYRVVEGGYFKSRGSPNIYYQRERL